MKKYIYLLMMGFFFTTFQVVEVEAQRGDPGMDRGRGDVRPDPRGPGNPPDRRDPRMDTRDPRGPGNPPDRRDPRGPANPPDRGAANPPDRGGDTVSDDRPWRDILKNCRQMKKKGALTGPMKKECKRARAMKKGRR